MEPDDFCGTTGRVIDWIRHHLGPHNPGLDAALREHFAVAAALALLTEIRDSAVRKQIIPILEKVNRPPPELVEAVKASRAIG